MLYVPKIHVTRGSKGLTSDAASSASDFESISVQDVIDNRYIRCNNSVSDDDITIHNDYKERAAISSIASSLSCPLREHGNVPRHLSALPFSTY